MGKRFGKRYIFADPDALCKSGDVLNEVINQYFPKLDESNSNNILELPFLKDYKYTISQEYSLKKEIVAKGWQQFLSDLPNSKDEFVPQLQDQYWHWKIFKKYCPTVRTNFRKSMKAGPALDQFGRFPLSGESLQLYRK